MAHDNIDATIMELTERVESIRDKMHKNAELAGHRGTGSEPIDPEKLNRGMKAMEQNKVLSAKLVLVFDALARAYQQKGDKNTTRYYFEQAKAERFRRYDPSNESDSNNKVVTLQHMLKGCQQRIELIEDELISSLNNAEFKSTKNIQCAVVHLSRIVNQAETLKADVLEMFE